MAESALRARESIDGGKVIALPMVGGPHQLYTRRATRAKLWIPHDVGGELRALRGAKADAALDLRMAGRRQRT